MMETDNRPQSGENRNGDSPRSEQSGSSTSVGNMAGQAADTAKSVIGQAKNQALDAVEQHKEGIADRIEDVAQAVHRSGEQFEGKQDWIAHAIEQGAAELNMIASALRDNDIMSLAGKVQTLAKRQPALFIGASLMAGFAIARLGKIAVTEATADDLPSMPRIDHAAS